MRTACAAGWLALLALAGAAASVAPALGGHATVGYYALGTERCDDTVCTDHASPLLCGQAEPAVPIGGSPAIVWPNGVCGLALPSEPWFRITVTDALGTPVRFGWGVYLADLSSCTGKGAVHATLAYVPEPCQGRDARVYVVPWLGSVGGKVVLTPAP